MPPAARISDSHTCPKHSGGPVEAGCSTVIIGHQPAARVGDAAKCAGGSDPISQGEPSVIIGNKAAARLGDPTSHGGVVAAGCPSVIIGSSPEAVLKTDRPFCEDCVKKRKAKTERRRGKSS